MHDSTASRVASPGAYLRMHGILLGQDMGSSCVFGSLKIGAGPLGGNCKHLTCATREVSGVFPRIPTAKEYRQD